jgi:threonine aldolase
VARDNSADAIIECMSPVFAAGVSLGALESDVATLLGKPSGMFCVSGVMAQLIAARVHSETAGGKLSIVLHPSSHLLRAEHDAYRHIMNLNCVGIGDVHRALTLHDFEAAEAAGAFPDDVFCVFLELGQRFNGGDVPDWDELLAISRFCQGKGWKLHMDGARLWEAYPYYAATASVGMPDIAGLFDTVYVSWYKGMGALSGATLVGSSEFITQARVWLRRMGGNLFTVMPLEGTLPLVTLYRMSTLPIAVFLRVQWRRRRLCVMCGPRSPRDTTS